MKYFILTTTDTEDINGKQVPAYQIASKRLSKGYWPLYASTKNKFLVAAGDKCLIYIAGYKLNRQKIVAEIVVKEIQKYSRSKHDIDQDALTDLPSLIIVFESSLVLPKFIEIRPLLSNLKFINMQKRWGIMLMGGCKPIPIVDYNLIMGNSFAET